MHSFTGLYLRGASRSLFDAPLEVQNRQAAAGMSRSKFITESTGAGVYVCAKDSEDARLLREVLAEWRVEYYEFEGARVNHNS